MAPCCGKNQEAAAPQRILAREGRGAIGAARAERVQEPARERAEAGRSGGADRRSLGRRPLIVLDTHAWIWWVADPARLSRAAKKAIEKERVRAVCAICVWERPSLTERPGLP